MMSVKATAQKTPKNNSVSSEAKHSTVQSKHAPAGPGVPLFLKRTPLASPEGRKKH